MTLSLNDLLVMRLATRQTVVSTLHSDLGLFHCDNDECLKDLYPTRTIFFLESRKKVLVALQLLKAI